MQIPVNLHHRYLQPELMDDPYIVRHAHIQALRGLSRLYRASRTGAALWPVVRKEAEAINEPLRILDIATGGGDFPLDIADRARRSRLNIDVHGCDISPTAVAFARLRARNEKSSARFFRFDVNAGPIPSGYHMVTSGLFLHHLDEPTAACFLRKMASAATRIVIVDDLIRSRLGLLLAYIATRTLSRSAVVHRDGPQSVRSAFTKAELLGLARSADLSGAEVSQHWPQRQTLTWRRPGTAG